MTELAELQKRLIIEAVKYTFRAREGVYVRTEDVTLVPAINQCVHCGVKHPAWKFGAVAIVYCCELPPNPELVALPVCILTVDKRYLQSWDTYTAYLPPK